MKKIKMIVIMAVLFISGCESVYAGCHTEKLYSVESYMKHYDLIDTVNSEGSMGFFNSENIFIKINSLGTYYNVSLISNEILTNPERKYTVNEKEKNDPVYMYLEFDESVRIGEIVFDIDAVNSRTGDSVTKRIYANSNKYCDNEATGHLSVKYGELLYEGNSNDLQNLSADNIECRSLLIEFDYDRDNVYTLNYFQVSEYSKKEHSGWTSEYIAGTSYKNIVICDGSGEYIPDGSSGKWYQEYTTVFSPSVDIISDYIPKITSSYAVKYDAQSNGKLAYSSSPDEISSYFNDYSRIGSWTSIGNLPYRSYYSNGLDSEYIMTSETEGYRYRVVPYYWDGSGKNSVHKLDSSYCSVFTSKNIRPCYKHYGHISYIPANYFDIYIQKYRNIVPEENRKIDSVEYYLCSEEMSCKFITENNDLSYNYNFRTSGKYYLKALLKDAYGNSNSKRSELFLIDNEKPNVNFRSEVTDCLHIIADITDEHSGISYYTYQLSEDGGKTYSEKSERFYNNQLELDIHSSGDFKLKINAVDNASNSVTEYSDVFSQYLSDISVSEAYGFSYERNETGVIHYRIKREGDDKPQDIDVRIYQDDELLSVKTIRITDEYDDSFSYTGSDISSEFKIEILNKDVDSENNELFLKTYAKNGNLLVSSNAINKVSGIVCSMVNNGVQHDYYENLVLQIVQDKKILTAGSGVEIRVNTDYFNECYAVDDFKCSVSVDSDLKFKAEFKEGALSLKDIFNNGDKSFKQKMIKDASVYRLQPLYTDKFTGEMFADKEYPELLNAGNKWYSSFTSEFGLYPYKITGNDMGVNEFDFEFTGGYQIDSVYSDKLKVRFVDPDNPFPNTKGDIWNNLDFFEELGDEVMKIYDIF